MDGVLHYEHLMCVVYLRYCLLKDCCCLGVNFVCRIVRDFIRVCLLYPYKRGKVITMPVDKYRGVTLQRELIDKIEQYIEDYPEQGYKSIADFVTDAVRRRAEELQLFQVTPRFQHFNTYEDSVVILDRKLGSHVNAVTLRVKPVGENRFELYCERCSSTSCEHVLYATTIPEVVKSFEKRGGQYKGEWGEERK